LVGNHIFDSNVVYDINFGDNVDHIITAAELVRMGKDKVLLIDGGGSPAKDGLQAAKKSSSKIA